jgi:hypothetical protein
MVLSEPPSLSFKRSKPRLDQNRTARTFALLTPTCVAPTPARAIHSENSIVPAPRPGLSPTGSDADAPDSARQSVEEYGADDG